MGVGGGEGICAATLWRAVCLFVRAPPWNTAVVHADLGAHVAKRRGTPPWWSRAVSNTTIKAITFCTINPYAAVGDSCSYPLPAQKLNLGQSTFKTLIWPGRKCV